MAAERLAEAGISVVIFDRMPSVGRKLLMAGRGGLNLTHSEELSCFLQRYSSAEAVLAPLIQEFSPQHLRTWCHGLGQETFVGTSGRVFPVCMKASPLLRTWLARLKSLGVTVRLRHRWIGWNATGELMFEAPDVRLSAACPDVTVLALGGASWPRLGADGSWVSILEQTGVSVRPLKPSNTGIAIRWSEVFRSRFEGQPIKRMAVTFNGETIRGEGVVTRYGLEGGAAYSHSGAIRSCLESGKPALLQIDVRPSFELSELVRKLSAPRNKQSTANFLRKAVGMAPIAIGLLREGAGGPLPVDTADLAALIKNIRIAVTGLGGLDQAISTAGGVSFHAVNDQLMLHARPGVFAAGEMLDWDAPTGGYLLQATLATAVRAADGALEFLGRSGATRSRVDRPGRFI